MTSPNDAPPPGEFILFQSEDGQARVECRFETDTLSPTQAMLTELYGKAKTTISEHVSNVFEEGELDQEAVVRLFRTTAADGKCYQVQYYSLPLVIAVGYRVRSARGTEFRHWATQSLQEYLVKGFVMDDERLKNPPVGSSAVPDYSDEMLERIRDIRANERRVFLQDWQVKLDDFLRFNDRDLLSALAP